MADALHYSVYRGAMPCLIAVGLVFNAIAIVILARPRIKSARVTRYFQVLAVSDLLVCVFHVPIAVTIDGCELSSYPMAFYYAHFSWTLLGVCQSVSTWTIVWLAMDRFMAVWLYQLYPGLLKRPNVFKNRMVSTVVVSVGVYVGYMVNGTAECTAGKCTATTGFGYMFDETWHKVYRAFFGLVVRWVPMLFMVLFNLSLVLAVVQGRVKHPIQGQAPSTKRNDRKLILIMIAITASYILLTMPITLYVMFFADFLKDRCSGQHPEEMLRGAGNLLQLTEYVIHVVFLALLNHAFRRELKVLLRLQDDAASNDPDLDHNGFDTRSLASSAAHRCMEVVAPPPGKHLNVPVMKVSQNTINLTQK